MQEDDEARIKRMLEEGKLTAEEANQLSASLRGQQEHEENYAKIACAETSHSRRRFKMLILFFAGFFLLGLGGGLIISQFSTSQQQTAVGTVQETAQPKQNNGRLIDLQALDQERSLTMKKTGSISIIVIFLIVLAVLGTGLLLLYNSLVDAREKVNAGWAQVENVYQRRLDLVPVLIDGVKTYMEHERDTLTELTNARARAIEVGGMLGGKAPQSVEQLKAVEASQGAVESALTRLFAIVENYPDLKASQNFIVLQDQIEGTENRVAIERRNFNEFARIYNTRVQKFPSNLVAELLDFESKPYFQAEDKALQGLKDPFGRQQE